MANSVIPSHVAIIMDGNGRWAKQRGKIRSFGHQKGAENVEKVCENFFSKGVKTLTLYAFSTENWSRPKEEVDELMRLLTLFFKKSISKVVKKNVRLTVIGERDKLSEDILNVIEKAENQTKNNTEYNLNIAINYGGRQEIVSAVNKILAKGEKVSVETLSNNLYTSFCKEPDLIIRTGGELRTSNFLVFQGAYSELYFTDCLWPDFDDKEIDKALEAFSKRNRRFGGI